MKKVFGVILALFYLTLSTGASINMHFCKGKLKDIQINSTKVGCCCGGKMNKKCCQNEEVVLNIDTDQNIISIGSILPDKIALVVNILAGLELIEDSAPEDNSYSNYNIPPPKLEPLWLLNCSLTYYG